MDKLLTIVIPAFNMEKYLHRCLSSIVCSEETMKRVQIIVVNDGSKDGTSEIAHQYENKYPYYFQVIDKANGNYGSCMNIGLSRATGKYFRTLDADDWYNTAAYEQFVNILEDTDADMLISERDEFFEETGEQIHLSFSEEAQTNQDLKADKSIWNIKSVRNMCHVSSVCFKTSILKQANMRWDENVFYTDNEYLFFPLEYVRTIRLVSSPVYVYLKGRSEQSVSMNSIKKNFHSYNIVTNSILDRFISNGNEDSCMYPLQLKILKEDLFPFFYLTLIFDGLKNKSFVDNIERKIKNHPVLYDATNKVNNYRGLYYVAAYRDCLIHYYLIRLDYKLRSNKVLRTLLKKNA